MRVLVGGLAATVAALFVVSIALFIRSARLEEKLALESTRAISLEELLSETQRELITPEALELALDERLASTAARLDSLESRSEALPRVIATAHRSIVFLQGSYAFVETATGRPLRYVNVDQDGQPIRTADGSPVVSVDGEGPVAEAHFTGTGFIISRDGLVLTNRHVTAPWEATPVRELMERRGFRPVLRRFIGYLPGGGGPFDVEPVAQSDDTDLAILRCEIVPGSVEPLELSSARPSSGEEVVVLGYPAGITALVARADPRVLDPDTVAGRDFWSMAEVLAQADLIAPLATRGIVGQVTDARVVYDAETTSGGSGGPVLGLDGRVVAINTAVLVGFGGSNLGVPARRAVELLEAISPRLDFER